MVRVVAALLCKGEKFMICQRPRGKARALLWEFPGGKVEAGETEQQALVRECREELGIIVEPLDVFFDTVHEYSDMTIRLTLFRAIIRGGTPRLLEHADLKWITASEIDAYDFCPADVDILQKLRGQPLL